MLMGGPSASRKEAPISSAKQWNDKPNRYLEPIGEERIGILVGNVVFPTRLHQWRIEFRPTSKKASEYIVRETSLRDDRYRQEIDLEVLGASAPLEFCQ